MNTPEVQVSVTSEELIEAVGELAADLEPAGAIVIPVAGLPAGSVITLTITVGPGTPPAPEPAPEPLVFPTPGPRPRAMMGTGTR